MISYDFAMIPFISMDIKSYLISFIVACFSSHILVGWNLSMSWPSPTESQRHSWGMVSDRHMRIRGVILPAEMLGFVPKKKAEEGKCWTLRIVIRWLFEVHLTQKFGVMGHGMEQIWEFHPCRWPQPPATRRIQQLGVIASSNFGELRGIQLLAPQQSWDWLPHDRHVFIHEYPRVLSNDSPYDLAETWK